MTDVSYSSECVGTPPASQPRTALSPVGGARGGRPRRALSFDAGGRRGRIMGRGAEAAATCWRQVDARVRVSLTPAEVFGGNAARAAARHAFSSLLMRYHAPLGGVVVAQRGGLRFSKPSLAPSNPASPFAHVTATASLLVFAPPLGAVLVGTVAHVGPDHVGLALWATFHVVLPLANAGGSYAWDSAAQVWRARGEDDVAVGSVVRFAVVALRDTHGGIFHVAATLMDADGLSNRELGVQPGVLGDDLDSDVAAGADNGGDGENDGTGAPMAFVTPTKAPKCATPLGHYDLAGFDDALGSVVLPAGAVARRETPGSAKGGRKARDSLPEAKRSTQRRKDEGRPARDGTPSSSAKERRQKRRSEKGAKAEGVVAAGDDEKSCSLRRERASKVGRAGDRDVCLDAEARSPSAPVASGAETAGAGDTAETSTPTAGKKRRKRKRTSDADREAESQVASQVAADVQADAGKSSAKRDKKRRRREENGVAPTAAPDVDPPQPADRRGGEGDGAAGSASGPHEAGQRDKKLKLKKKRKRESLAKLGRRLSAQFQQSVSQG